MTDPRSTASPSRALPIADQLPDNGIMSPYADQDAPVVITAWGRQLELVGADSAAGTAA